MFSIIRVAINNVLSFLNLKENDEFKNAAMFF
jgi:hypothetical protein